MTGPNGLALEVRGLAFKYPGAKDTALADVDLVVNVGEVFGLLGPNGAGKTTLMSIVANLLTPQRGDIRLFGATRDSMEGRKLVAMAPQELALFSMLTVSENLSYFGGLCLDDQRLVSERAARTLEFVDLSRQRDVRVEELSGGMKRRLNLAVALMQEPRLLLLDEPTVGVDPQSRNLILARLQELKNKGLTIIYSTHYLEEAERICERVAIIDGGKILLEGAVATLTREKSLEDHFLGLTGRQMRD